MKKLFLTSIICLLNACLYAETPDGRFAAWDVNLPTHSATTINKTVTVNAPAGTTVILQETPPPAVIYRDAPRRYCYFDRRFNQRVCRQ